MRLLYGTFFGGRRFLRVEQEGHGFVEHNRPRNARFFKTLGGYMRVGHVVSIGIAALALGCGSSSNGVTDPPPPANGVNIIVSDFKFSPAVDTIKVGTTVQWVNNGPSEHSSTSDTGLWNSQGLTPPSGGGAYGGSSGGGTFRFTFTQTGSFSYHCMFHPPAQYPSFVGTIVVTN